MSVNITDSLLSRMRNLPTGVVKTAIKRWALTDFHGRKKIKEAMLEEGWEQIEATDGAFFTVDGRPISWGAGVPMALRKEIFDARIKNAMDHLVEERGKANQALKRETPGEALTSVLCPSCRAIMAKSPICPSCAKGKAGFKILCQCTECGHEVFL